ncbi:hypothetical protein [Anaerostipes sp. Marseille-Q3525]|uniref:hypothetical protein n=1 Tax=Anaerostipes sp. Marseille-Q3525 TaxID=2758418 RepID=UPI001BA48199|nr:hypothetical protein [Anaerostipes sp. Marseille-Q3525]MBR9962281.1 hypothetical protein [Anaerostipes sp. Marseille-Q3525]
MINLSSIETLIKKNDVTGKDRWYPQAVELYKASIKMDENTDEIKRMRSNFAYSMQYLEYIEKQIDELKLSSVLISMLYKTYIITGVGIIELLFVYILKKNEQWNQTEWLEYGNMVSNPKIINGETIRVETKICKRVSKYDMRMDLDSMIKKVEKKHIISINHEVYPALKNLRQLRNRVHLQVGDGAYDHDYNEIGLNEIQMMRRILYTILTVPEICRYKNCFKFIYDSYQKYK